jgi:4-methylaminobutanoate oxidase (formaldehyde-forming)
VVADLTITRLAEDHFWVITGSSFISNDLAWIQMNVQPGDKPVLIRDVTTEYACIALWGPDARQVLKAVTETDVSNQAIPYMTAKHIHICGVQVLAQRVSYIGELGWEIYVEYNRAVQVWKALLGAGKDFGMEVGGYKVLDALRLEKGYRYFTADVTVLENPYEAGLGFCVHLEKSDFIGKQALEKAKQASLRRKLCTIVLDGEEYASIYGGEAIYLQGKVISRVRSGGYGFTLKRNIVFAYLPMELTKVGTRLQVEVFDKLVDGEVSPAVLVDPKGARMKA